MSWASTAPAAIAAIGAACQAAITDATVEIGPVISDQPLDVVLVIAYQAPDTPAVEGQFTAEGMAALPDREKYAINCLITSTNGLGNFEAAQAAAFAVAGEVGGVLAANQRIGGTLSAHLDAWTLDILPVTDQGAVVELRFAVAVDAFTAT